MGRFHFTFKFYFLFEMSLKSSNCLSEFEKFCRVTPPTTKTVKYLTERWGGNSNEMRLHAYQGILMILKLCRHFEKQINLRNSVSLVFIESGMETSAQQQNGVWKLSWLFFRTWLLWVSFCMLALSLMFLMPFSSAAN